MNLTRFPGPVFLSLNPDTVVDTWLNLAKKKAG